MDELLDNAGVFMSFLGLRGPSTGLNKFKLNWMLSKEPLWELFGVGMAIEAVLALALAGLPAVSTLEPGVASWKLFGNGDCDDIWVSSYISPEAELMELDLISFLLKRVMASAHPACNF
uniref:Uncharacterized protein n=1 Tax=Candidozyma auris TaxID=498019 RepID=A0A0L0P871_CANAR